MINPFPGFVLDLLALVDVVLLHGLYLGLLLFVLQIFLLLLQGVLLLHLLLLLVLLQIELRDPLLEVVLLLVLLGLELLVALLVGEGLLLVLLLFQPQFLFVEPSHVGLFLFTLQIDLLFLVLELLVAAVVLGLFALNLSHELLDLALVRADFLFQLLALVLLLLFDVLLQTVDGPHELVLPLLLDEDLLGLLHCRLGLQLLLGRGVVVLNAKTGEHTVLTD